MKDGEEYNVRAVERALQILNCFDDDHPERGVSEIAEAVGLHKATTHRILTTLLKYGFIERSTNGSQYKLGMQCLDLGSKVLRRINLRREALPLIRQLSESIDETVDLSIMDQNMVLCVEMIPSSHTLTIAATVGKKLPAYCTAGGKLFLAHFTPDRLEEYLLEPRHQYTAHTNTNPEGLRNELNKVLSTGYAFDEQEMELGVRAVAAPIFDQQKKMVGSLSIPGPVSRLTNEHMAEIIPVLLQTTREISRRLGYPG